MGFGKIAGRNFIGGVMNKTSIRQVLVISGMAMAYVAMPVLGFNASTVPGLQVWLKADAGVVTNVSGTVTNWQDQSGNGHNGSGAGSNPKFTAASSTLGGMPSLSFDDSNTGISLGNLSASFPTAASVFVVTYVNDTLYNVFDTDNKNNYWRYDGDKYAYPGTFRVNRIDHYAEMPASGACLFQVDSSASLWRTFTNGFNLGDRTGDYGAGDDYKIGFGTGAGAFRGEIAEVLIYSRVLSSNEAVKVGAYLVDKYLLSAPIIDPDLPSINNATGASGVATTSAILNGSLVRTGSTATAVTLYYGLSDGGTNPGAWGASHDFGVSSAALPAAYNYPVSGLTPNSAYYYTYAASNATDTVWPRTRENFITGNVWIEKIGDPSEIGLVPSTVMVVRALSATNCALKVNYQQIGGTAIAAQDYVAFSGQITIPIGVTNTPLIIMPLPNWIRQTTSTLDLGLNAGGYLIGASSNVSLTIENNPIPGSPTNVWIAASAGNASSDANWSLGHTPLATEQVLLGAYSVQNMTWDVTNAVAAWWQMVAYNGTVTVATRYDAAFPCMTISGNCQILGGTWTHPIGSSGDTAIYHMRVAVGGDFTLAGIASINLNDKGYAANYYGGYGPGKVGYDANYERGASHGGLGGSGNHDPSWDKTYGSITSPTNLGSSANSAGGGAMHLSVQGTATIDGAVSASVAGNSTYVSAAAGGSIFIEAGYLAGAGTLSVVGQNSTSGGAGGGGRIAVILASGSTFGNVTMAAYGGSASIASRAAAAGTIYRRVTGQAAGTGSVTIDNNNSVTVAAMTMATPTEPDLTQFSEVILTNRGFLALNTNSILDWIAQPNLKVYGPSQSLLMAQNTVGVTLSSDFALANFSLYLFTNLNVAGDMLVSNATFVIAAPMASNLVVQGNLHIATNGSIAHWLGGENYRINAHVGNNLTIDAGGSVNVDGLGFPSASGPGAGANGGNTVPAASYGGLGAPKPGIVGQPVTYGSLLAPTNFGSGADTYGGGAIQMSVARTSTVNGAISAKSGIPNGMGSGSGGSIYLTTGWLEGNGTIDASSPDFPSASLQYGGGGGRIAVILSQSSSFGAVSMKAYGADPLNCASSYSAAAGTIYKQTVAQGTGRGTIVVDNHQTVTSPNITTQIPASVPSDALLAYKFVGLVATNGANVEILTNITMGNLFLCDDSVKLWLNGHTLTLKAIYHADWGTTNRVDYTGGGEIIWDPGAGTIFTIR